MPVNEEVVWTLEPHTVGKHNLLREYLTLWLRILGAWYGDLVLYDGFAGPGEYKDGEEGSPIIMLRQAMTYVSRRPKARVHCTFVEKDPARLNHLNKLVEGMSLPEGVQVYPALGEFANEVVGALRYIAQRQDIGPVPSFFMIDPFGIKGVPFSVFHSLLALEKSECLFTLMWDTILRHREHNNLEGYMLELFGDSEWHGMSSEELKEYVYSRFEQRLRKAGAKYVLVFDLWKEGRHIYSLFFATKGIKGCDIMKQVICKLDVTGSYSFRGSRPGQSQLDMTFDSSRLEDDLRAEFNLDWVAIEQAEEFVRGDKTRFHSGHLKKQTLVPLERAGSIVVERPDGVRGFQTGKGIRFRFSDVPSPSTCSEQLPLFPE